MNRTHALLVAASFGVVGVLYRALPLRVPIHFDLAGRANDWMDKPLGALLLPLTMLGLAVGCHTLRRHRGIELAGTITLAFLLYLTLVTLAVGAGHHLDISRAVFAGAGVFFVALGNSLGKLRRNGLVGIRTPWTLADDEVWLRTHRLAGPILMLAGVLLVLETLVNAAPVLLVATLLISLAVPAAYSYVVHRRLRTP